MKDGQYEFNRIEFFSSYGSAAGLDICFFTRLGGEGANLSSVYTSPAEYSTTLIEKVDCGAIPLYTGWNLIFLQ